MEKLFLRDYSLSIGRDTSIVSRTTSPLTIIPNGEESRIDASQFILDGEENPWSEFGGYTDFLVTPSSHLTIKELNIKATILSSNAGNSDTQETVIEILNLSDINVSKIRAEDIVILRAGYKSLKDLPIIFVGHVIKVSTTNDNSEDRTTKIICSMSSIPRKNIKISKIPLQGETTQSIADYFAGIAAKNGIPTGNIFIPISQSYDYGFPAVGYFWDIMDEFCQYNNLKNYISLGKLYIEPIDSLQFTDVVAIEPFNVKGSISLEEDSATTTGDKNKIGIVFSTFLDGRITLDKKIRVTYGEFKGDYKPMSIEFRLDLEGSYWDTVVSATKIG